MKTARCMLASVLLLGVLAFSSPVLAQSVVVPNGFANLAGGAFSDGFNCQRPNGVRSQTVYLGTEVGQVTLESLAVRGLPGSPAFGPQLFPNVIIKLSTTDKFPGGLSNTFADNIGTDETIVFQGSFISNIPNCTGLSPCPFASPLNFQNPFPFDPADGNLLVEVIVPFCQMQFALPDADATNDPMGLIIQSLAAEADDANEGLILDGGPIIEFNSAGIERNVPTLSEWGLIAMAIILGGVGFMVIRKRKAMA